jgi:hypothetical protein
MHATDPVFSTKFSEKLFSTYDTRVDEKYWAHQIEFRASTNEFLEGLVREFNIRKSRLKNKENIVLPPALPVFWRICWCFGGVMTLFLELLPAVSALLDRIIPDPEAREKAKLELMKSENAQALQIMQLALTADDSQNSINEAEARNANLFVSGWRPFIGWVCGVAFAYHYVLQPLMVFGLVNSGQEVHLPSFDMGELSTVLMGLLGLGGLRTLEKISKPRGRA